MFILITDCLTSMRLFSLVVLKNTGATRATIAADLNLKNVLVILPICLAVQNGLTWKYNLLSFTRGALLVLFMCKQPEKQQMRVKC